MKVITGEQEPGCRLRHLAQGDVFLHDGEAYIRARREGSDADQDGLLGRGVRLCDGCLLRADLDQIVTPCPNAVVTLWPKRE